MSYSKISQKKYSQKGLQFSVNYRPTDVDDGLKLKNFLEQTGQSANSYIKNLIKTDLIAQGFYLTDDNNNNDGANDNNDVATDNNINNTNDI